MSHFYGILKGNRGRATRCATAAMYVNAKGRDCYIVERGPWQGRGTYRLLARGRMR